MDQKTERKVFGFVFFSFKEKKIKWLPGHPDFFYEKNINSFGLKVKDGREAA